MPPDTTRQVLLNAAFHEIHRKGFQSASLTAILNNAGVTKGALYHYFGSKRELGYAVLEEVISDHLRTLWLEPLAEATGDPVTQLKDCLIKAGEQLNEKDIRLGCPLNNLAQEMSPIDQGFRERTDVMYKLWLQTISSALQNGQQLGKVRQVSLRPRERFWDIPVPKIDSAFDSLFVPRPSRSLALRDN
ncbi:MAG: TetR/AcrR family transcriptional regulator, partial [gamma proteobacterium endosymbiont of Lamellibrachia anaximandri]|nr:TetR/AcrR family transcriptional regulator [gamma proteobacterium endosymbiont of Lamellibrachia anaximandri]